MGHVFIKQAYFFLNFKLFILEPKTETWNKHKFILENVFWLYFTFGKKRVVDN